MNCRRWLGVGKAGLSGFVDPFGNAIEEVGVERGAFSGEDGEGVEDGGEVGGGEAVSFSDGTVGLPQGLEALGVAGVLGGVGCGADGDGWDASQLGRCRDGDARTVRKVKLTLELTRKRSKSSKAKLFSTVAATSGSITSTPIVHTALLRRPPVFSSGSI
jgi:hypothetical protein